MFPDFDLQSPIISLQASHPLQVGGQAVIQALHSVLLTLDAPYAHQTPSHPYSQDPGFPTALHAGGVGHQDPGAQAPSAYIDAGHTAGWPDLVAGRLHRAQGPVACGTAGACAEAHVVQGGR